MEIYSKSLCKFLVVAIFGIVFPSLAQASVYITEIDRLNFALLEIPSGGSKHRIIIPASGGAHHGNGVVLMGMPRRGEYFITSPFDSDARRTISIDIQNISTGSPALKLRKFKGIYGSRNIESFPAWGLSNPGKGGKTLYLGASLVYKSAVEERVYHPSFDIIIIYE